MSKPIRILYVEDSTFDRELVQDALAQEGEAFALVMASNRAEFEQRLAEEDFDLVLTDFNIMGFEGLQVLEIVHHQKPDLPVLIVTGTGSEEIAVKALKNGAVDYVIKSPGHIRRLPATIRAALEKKRLQQAEREYFQRLEEEVRQRTEQLLQAQQALHEQQQLAALGRLAGNLSQELLNPLAVMSNAVYFLQHIQPNPDPKVKEYLDMLQQEISQTERIVTDMLSFARLRPLNQAPVRLGLLVNYALYRFPPPQAVNVEVDLPDNLPEVFIDLDQIMHCLGNVLLNAYQALCGEDLLSPPVVQPALVRLSAAFQEPVVRLAVRDNGPGIPPENLPRLGEPMFTTKLRALGLGLTVCKQLLQANNGWLEVHSQPGQGSEFVLCLPVMKADPGQSPHAAG